GGEAAPRGRRPGREADGGGGCGVERGVEEGLFQEPGVVAHHGALERRQWAVERSCGLAAGVLPGRLADEGAVAGECLAGSEAVSRIGGVWDGWGLVIYTKRASEQAFAMVPLYIRLDLLWA